ncbi:MAG: divergent polysaccharide deacetylase family protein, partial [Alphaproteobacteria bacterium]|nr:divergent polysaccharide deacetylase family protein [Alphaproteobacteria bacterium]
ARRFGVPHARRHVFLDNEARIATVRQRLGEVELIATLTGFAVAIGHPRDATLEVLEEWLPDVIARGFALVPISAIALRERTGG